MTTHASTAPGVHKFITDTYLQCITSLSSAAYCMFNECQWEDRLLFISETGNMIFFFRIILLSTNNSGVVAYKIHKSANLS